MSADDQGFAEVLNGFSLDSGRRFAARRKPTPEPAAPQATTPAAAAARPAAPEPNASFVRAYAWTGGRTRSSYRLEIETLVSTSTRALDRLWDLAAEHQEVAELCGQSKSVAEVAALLKLPLGVAKVLLGDMATLGLIVVHENASANPDMELLERVLRGLTKLRV
ncbi:hypothetical protein JOF56_006229 [Kibdelosporangium banguiense]|uniref:DUF742 domain-containing protein n=1 Tax=Kibdelosporangium banguiense TaxID=1365924 RepID=A0ABS4TNA5_9PSEU|nr:DUF742 domain-containing protein [Kibdelosporangium banguiense]MBP2325844.1 hypothetical protein [Kibdelosporangium banguiense]